MKLLKGRIIFFPFSLFIISLLLVISETFKFTSVNSTSELMDKGFYYLVNILMWISGAALLNGILQNYILSSLSLKISKGILPKYFTDLISALFYTLSFAAIIVFVFQNNLDASWISILFIILILILALRKKFLEFFNEPLLTTERSYNIGDWVEIFIYNKEKVFGQVKDFNRKIIKIKTKENATVIIPNNLFDSIIVKNYSSNESNTKCEISFYFNNSISYEHIKKVLFAGALQASYLQGFNGIPKVVINKVSKNDTEFKIIYWIDAWEKLLPEDATDKINSTILNHLSYAGLPLVYSSNDLHEKQQHPFTNGLSDTNYRIELLSRIEIFRSLEKEELQILAKNLTIVNPSKSEKIIEQNDSADSMFILIEGLMEVNVFSKDKIVNVGQITPGQFFGEMTLLTGEPRSATITCLVDCLALEITKENLLELLKLKPHVVEKISEIIAERESKNKEKIGQANEMKDKFTKQLLKKIKSFFNI